MFHNIDSKIGARVQDAQNCETKLLYYFKVKSILKYLFPVPKKDSRRVVTFSNEDDFISFRQHTYKKGDGGAIELLVG